MATANGFAIEGDDFSGYLHPVTLGTVAKAFAKLLKIKQCEDPPKGGVGGDFVGEFEKRLEPN